jgi:hypothetical protein
MCIARNYPDLADVFSTFAVLLLAMTLILIIIQQRRSATIGPDNSD